MPPRPAYGHDFSQMPIHPETTTSINAVSHRNDAAEQEARSVAEQVVSGRSVRVQAAPEAAVARDEDDAPPTVSPFAPTSPLGPINLGLLPGSPLGGGIGYGAPLAPVLPELETDPRAPRPGPFVGTPGSGSGDPGPQAAWGVGLQGRYGQDEKSIGAGVTFHF